MPSPTLKQLSEQAALLLCWLLGIAATINYAQAQERERIFDVVSPEISSDGKVTFRLYAPGADIVRLGSFDIPGNGPGAPMTKDQNGIWEVTFSEIPPGAYRYIYIVDSIPTVDPRNARSSESYWNVSSLLIVPNPKFQIGPAQPQGVISNLHYWSTTLKTKRRLHVYTPPKYFSLQKELPVLYLLHGTGDSDNTWATVGQVRPILDHLIVSGKAKPMLVVMCANHTEEPGEPHEVDQFSSELMRDIIPTIESNFRVSKHRQHRAIAGHARGGRQSLEIGLDNLGSFANIGVFSSGFQNDSLDRYKSILNDPNARESLSLLYFACGKKDFRYESTLKSVKLLEEHKFSVRFVETDGSHLWISWREHLADMVPHLFQ